MPLATGPTAAAPSDFVALDNGTTRKATLLSLADVINPPASQAEAEAGTDAVKRMTPLTTGQAISALGPSLLSGDFATPAQGDKADTAYQPTNSADVMGSTINSKAVYNRVRDSVNLLDYADDQADISALVTGAKSILTAWNLAVTDAVSRGIKVINLPSGVLSLSDGQTLDNPGLSVRGSATGSTTLKRVGAGAFFATSRTAPNVNTDGYSITANAAEGAVSITLSPANAALFTANTDAIIRSTKLSTFTAVARDAEFVRIRSVNLVSGVITLYGPLYFSYATADSSKLFPITLTEGVGYSDLEFDWTLGTPTSPQRPPFNVDECIVSTFCRSPKFRNITTRKTISTSIMLHCCIGATVDNFQQFDGYCDGFDMVDAYSYGIAEVGLNLGLVVNGGYSERSRHGYTSLASDSTNPKIFLGGHPMFSQINHFTVVDMKAAGLDTHGAGIEIEFNDCHVAGARGAGFQLRSYKNRINACSARDILPLDGTTNQGHGVWLIGQLVNDLACRYAVVRDFVAYNCFGAGVYDQAQGTLVDGVKLERTGEAGIVASGTGAGDFDYNNIRLIDVARSPTLGAYGVVLGTDLQKNPRITNLFASDPSNRLSAIVRRNLISVDRLELDNVKGVNSSFERIPEVSSVTNNSGVFLRNGYGPSGYGTGPTTQVTISASDALDISKIIAAECSPLPFSGVSDSISTIVGADREAVLKLIGSSGNTLTLVHGTGANNLFLKGGVNATLLPNMFITLEFSGGVWKEVSRSF